MLVIFLLLSVLITPVLGGQDVDFIVGTMELQEEQYRSDEQDLSEAKAIRHFKHNTIMSPKTNCSTAASHLDLQQKARVKRASSNAA